MGTESTAGSGTEIPETYIGPRSWNYSLSALFVEE